MKRFSFIILLLLCYACIHAQKLKTISGKIYDSTIRQPVRGATVQWLNDQNRLISATVSDGKGYFELKIKEDAGSGRLQILFVGYTPLNIPVNASEGDRLLNTLCLLPKPGSLKDVNVTGQKSGYRIEPDKRVYDVAGNLSAKGGTLEEVFRQVPGVTVTPSGKLSLRNGPPVILIDGKRTDLTLEQIPAAQVASVEIVTTPSAKYDAQGGSGIINILMKKDKASGFSGNVEGNYTSLPERTLDGNIAYTKGKFTVRAAYFQHWHREKYTDDLLRSTLADGSFLQQHSFSETKGPFETGRLSVDYRLNNRNTFTLSGNYGGGNFKTRKEQASSYFDDGGAKDEGSLRTTLSEENFRFGHANADYSHQFKKEGEKLIASFNLEQYNAPTSGTYRMQYALPDGIPDERGLQQYSGGIKAHTITLQSDYTDPLRGGEAKLEAGFKLNWHHDHNHNLMQNYDSASTSYVTDKNATYNFYYQDPTYAAYGNYSDKYGWFSFMAGLRFEQYNYTGAMPDSAVTFRYHSPDIFPSLFLTADLGNGQELHLNYSRRTNRPAFDEVSPRTDYSDPQNLSRGNPHLQSEYTNLAELFYNLQKNATIFSMTFYIRNTSHFITTYTTTLAPDTLLTTYANADHSNTFGGELLYKTAVVKWWNITANANFSDTHIAASNIADGLSNSGFGWFAKLGSDIKLPQSFVLQLSGTYEAPKIIPQGKTLSTGSADISLKKDFLKDKKLSVILSLADVFNTSREKRHTYMPGQYDQTYLQKYDTRIFKISMSWSFGSSKG